jgi:carbon storage regulator CsrA
MLILSRKNGESVVIVSPQGTSIEVLVTKVDYNQAKIGINAPADFKIFRKEIYDRVMKS